MQPLSANALFTAQSVQTPRTPENAQRANPENVRRDTESAVRASQKTEETRQNRRLDAERLESFIAERKDEEKRAQDDEGVGRREAPRASEREAEPGSFLDISV